MSIYIDNMDMPTKENTVILISPYGDVWMIGDMPNEDTHLAKAKAISVPAHGRLIDADAILQEATKGEEPFDWIDKNELLRLFFDAPTIIPAELPVNHGTFAATSEQEALKRITPAEECENK